MPTLIVENVPTEVYERLKKLAEAERRSLPKETLHLLTQLLREDIHPAPRLPDLIPRRGAVGPLRPTPVEPTRGDDALYWPTAPAGPPHG